MKLQEAKKLENKVLEKLKNHLKKNDTVILALSGGPDSVFLLEMLKKLPLKIIAAHVNHHLRKESDKDQKFVENLHETITKSAKIAELSQKNKAGIEETGRKIRYEFFQKLAKTSKAKYILTAHHADDNLETIIHNLTRGTTLKGLAGIEEISQNLFRPLLEITKDEIIAYLKIRKIPYLTDKSNKDTIYKRNDIRKNIVPHLKKLNPNLPKLLAKNTKNLREIDDFLQKEAQKWLKQNQNLDAKKFRTLHPALQKTILKELHKTHAKTTKNLESIHFEEVLTLINNNIGNKKKKLGQLTVTIKNNQIHLSP